MTKARIIADYAGTGATTDLATQAELNAVSTVANAALPKAGGTMTGNIVMGDDTSIGISDTDERIEFDGAGDISVMGANFGIGTDAPDTSLHIHNGSAGTVDTFSDTHFSIERDDATGMSILAPTDALGVIRFGTGGDPTRGSIKYFHSAYSTSSYQDSMFLCTGDDATRIHINGTGKIGMGCAPSDDRLYIDGDIRGNTTGRILWFNYLKGHGSDNMHIDASSSHKIYLGYYTTTSIMGAGGSTLHSQSDERLKDNISTLSNALTKLKTIRGVNFKWKENTWSGDQVKDDDGNRKNQIGVIAQEVEVEFPELIDEGIARFKDESAEDGWANVEGYKYVGTVEFIPYLIEAVKELSATNDALEVENTALKTRMDALEARVTALENA